MAGRASRGDRLCRERSRARRRLDRQEAAREGVCVTCFYARIIIFSFLYRTEKLTSTSNKSSQKLQFSNGPIYRISANSHSSDSLMIFLDVFLTAEAMREKGNEVSTGFLFLRRYEQTAFRVLSLLTLPSKASLSDQNSWRAHKSFSLCLLAP